MPIRTKHLDFSIVSPIAIGLIFIGFSNQAGAQEDNGYMEEATEEHAPEEVPEEGLTTPPRDPDAVRHGVGLRARYIFMPKALIEVFVEEASSGVSQTGFGLDYVRRKKDFEISVGFEYDGLAPDDGYFVESGGSPTELGSVDSVEFEGLSWFTIDAAFVYHHTLSELVALRYGGGIGLGVVRGEIYTTDAQCTGPDAQGQCSPSPVAPREKEDFFRFPPVFNALAGVQLTPADNFAINIELGMRTVFYTGIGVQYFFR